jgi:hypothetical protein
MRRKKKLPSINGNSQSNITPVKTPTTTAAPTTPTTPTTPPSPTSINTAIAKSLPSVPSMSKNTNRFIDLCLTPTLAVIQLFHGVSMKQI